MGAIRSLCGNAFEKLGQMLNSNKPTQKTVKCPKCGTDIPIEVAGTSGNIDFTKPPGSGFDALCPWKEIK